MQQKINIEAGSLILSLMVDDKDLAFLISRVFQAFISEKESQLHMSLSLKAIKPRPYKVLCTGEAMTVETSFFSAQLDFNIRKGKLFIAPHENLDIVLRNAVKSVFVFWVIAKGGVVFHSSAVLDKGKAHIFAGPSGVGKSTLVDNSKNKTVLSEEVVAILRSKNGYKAFALPYSGDERLKNRTTKDYDLGSLNILMHGKSNSRRLLDKASALAQLYIMPSGMNEVSDRDKLLKRYEEVVSLVPCYKLAIKPDPSFWELFE